VIQRRKQETRYMAEKVAVAGSDSKQRVAYELAQEIARHEGVDDKAPRRYWLELYRQCLKVVNGQSLPSDLRERSRDDDDDDEDDED
jgi:hypothetical protein